MAAPSMEDWFGINNVFIRYANSLDRGDVDSVVECFGEDASLNSPVLGEFFGHAGVRDFAARTARLKREHGAHSVTSCRIWRSTWKAITPMRPAISSIS